MAYNNEEALRCIIDIETCPLDDAAAYLEPAEAPSNYKDAAAIAKYIAAKNAENLARAALDVDLCRVVAIGWKREDTQADVITTRKLPEDVMLMRFWDVVGNRVTVGFNSCGFDLPVLLRRSLYLNVPTPTVNLDRYRTNHIDLQQRLSFNGLLKYRSLSFYCKRFGIPCEDEIDGSDIGRLVKEEQWDQIAAHCRSDVLKTEALAKRMGLLQQQPLMTEAAF